MMPIANILQEKRTTPTVSSPLTYSLPEYYTAPNAPADVRPARGQTKDVATAHVRSALHAIRQHIDTLLQLLDTDVQEASAAAPLFSPADFSPAAPASAERIIEGVFNGEHMVGQDGVVYPVPPNYAGKCKLVEGDLLTLTIAQNGALLYKQTQSISRARLTGELSRDPATRGWVVHSHGRAYRVLPASVTFHKGRRGDTATLLVPDTGESSWGAVESISR